MNTDEHRYWGKHGDRKQKSQQEAKRDPEASTKILAATSG